MAPDKFDKDGGLCKRKRSNSCYDSPHAKLEEQSIESTWLLGSDFELDFAMRLYFQISILPILKMDDDNYEYKFYKIQLSPFSDILDQIKRIELKLLANNRVQNDWSQFMENFDYFKGSFQQLNSAYEFVTMEEFEYAFHTLMWQWNTFQRSLFPARDCNSCGNCCNLQQTEPKVMVGSPPPGFEHLCSKSVGVGNCAETNSSNGNVMQELPSYNIWSSGLNIDLSSLSIENAPVWNTHYSTRESFYSTKYDSHESLPSPGPSYEGKKERHGHRLMSEGSCSQDGSIYYSFDELDFPDVLSARDFRNTDIRKNDCIQKSTFGNGTTTREKYFNYDVDNNRIGNGLDNQNCLETDTSINDNAKGDFCHYDQNSGFDYVNDTNGESHDYENGDSGIDELCSQAPGSPESYDHFGGHLPNEDDNGLLSLVDSQLDHASAATNELSVVDVNQKLLHEKGDLDLQSGESQEKSDMEQTASALTSEKCTKKPCKKSTNIVKCDLLKATEKNHWEESGEDVKRREAEKLRKKMEEEKFHKLRRKNGKMRREFRVELSKRHQEEYIAKIQADKETMEIEGLVKNETKPPKGNVKRVGKIRIQSESSDVSSVAPAAADVDKDSKPSKIDNAAVDADRRARNGRGKYFTSAQLKKRNLEN